MTFSSAIACEYLCNGSFQLGTMTFSTAIGCEWLWKAALLNAYMNDKPWLVNPSSRPEVADYGQVGSRLSGGM